MNNARRVEQRCRHFRGPVGIPQLPRVRSCWICFGSADDDDTASWVNPCGCSGRCAWAHQTCLIRWVDSQRRRNPEELVCCPECDDEYIVLIPIRGRVIKVLDYVEDVIWRVCPYMDCALLFVTMYWASLTFGAVTIIQIQGKEEGRRLISSTHPVILLIGLPCIPAILIGLKMVRWEDHLLRFVRHNSCKIPILRFLLPSVKISTCPNFEEVNRHYPIFSVMSKLGWTRVLAGAVFLPPIAIRVGNFMFSSVSSKFHRTILGGVLFVAVRGVLKMGTEQIKYAWRRERSVLDFNLERTLRTEALASTSNATNGRTA